METKEKLLSKINLCIRDLRDINNEIREFGFMAHHEIYQNIILVGFLSYDKLMEMDKMKYEKIVNNKKKQLAVLSNEIMERKAFNIRFVQGKKKEENKGE